MKLNISMASIHVILSLYRSLPKASWWKNNFYPKPMVKAFGNGFLPEDIINFLLYPKIILSLDTESCKKIVLLFYYRWFQKVKQWVRCILHSSRTIKILIALGNDIIRKIVDLRSFWFNQWPDNSFNVCDKNELLENDFLRLHFL